MISDVPRCLAWLQLGRRWPGSDKKKLPCVVRFHPDVLSAGFTNNVADFLPINMNNRVRDVLNDARDQLARDEIAKVQQEFVGVLKVIVLNAKNLAVIAYSDQ